MCCILGCIVKILQTILPGRVLAGCFWFCILIWISTYTANLAAFFTVRNSERQINTLEDVVEGDYPFYVMRDSAIQQFFRVAEYHTYRKLWERMNAADTFVNSTAEGYETARKGENAVFMAEKPSTEYIIMQKPCDLRTGKKKIFVTELTHYSRMSLNNNNMVYCVKFSRRVVTADSVAQW